MNIKAKQVFKTIRSQQGWTFSSLLFVMTVLLIIAYVSMQLIPVYLANQNIRNAMVQSLNETDLSTVSRGTIIRKMNAQLYLDGDHDLLNYKTDLKLRRSRTQFVIETHYQREVPLVFNLFLVAKFDNFEERELTQK